MRENRLWSAVSRPPIGVANIGTADRICDYFPRSVGFSQDTEYIVVEGSGCNCIAIFCLAKIGFAASQRLQTSADKCPIAAHLDPINSKPHSVFEICFDRTSDRIENCFSHRRTELWLNSLSVSRSCENQQKYCKGQ